MSCLSPPIGSIDICGDTYEIFECACCNDNGTSITLRIQELYLGGTTSPPGCTLGDTTITLSLGTMPSYDPSSCFGGASPGDAVYGGSFTFPQCGFVGLQYYYLRCSFNPSTGYHWVSQRLSSSNVCMSVTEWPAFSCLGYFGYDITAPPGCCGIDGYLLTIS